MTAKAPEMLEIPDSTEINSLVVESQKEVRKNPNSDRFSDYPSDLYPESICQPPP